MKESKGKLPSTFFKYPNRLILSQRQVSAALPFVIIRGDCSIKYMFDATYHIALLYVLRLKQIMSCTSTEVPLNRLLILLQLRALCMKNLH